MDEVGHEDLICYVCFNLMRSPDLILYFRPKPCTCEWKRLEKVGQNVRDIGERNEVLEGKSEREVREPSDRGGWPPGPKVGSLF